ncbi:MAG: hypothetical protein WCG27_03680 [Pseudomonadota bacterium]
MEDLFPIVLCSLGIAATYGVYYVIRRMNSAPPREIKSVESTEDNGQYHNDFSKVGSADTGGPVRPMLMTQDLLAQDQEEMQDLKSRITPKE